MPHGMAKEKRKSQGAYGTREGRHRGLDGHCSQFTKMLSARAL